MSQPLLSLRNLSIRFAQQQGDIQALRGISLEIGRGEIVGLVGESGSGKSTLALSVLRLQAPGAIVTADAMRLKDRNLLSLSDEAMRQVRGREIGIVFQDPMTSLNPIRSIGQMMVDAQHHQSGLSRREKLDRAITALGRVGLPDPSRQVQRFTFQFSGGMRQRIAIAMALLNEPELLIADEVTTALDATMENQILHLLRALREQTGSSILFVSHNLGAVAQLCDRVVVLYAGEIVEDGPVQDILANPAHPYTRALVACDPARIRKRIPVLPVIGGEIPDLRNPPAGCIFAARCAMATDLCHSAKPDSLNAHAGYRVACHFPIGGDL